MFRCPGLFAPEAHALIEVVHGCCFELVTSYQKRTAMRLAKGTVEPFLQFTNGQIWPDSGRKCLDVTKAFLGTVAVVQSRC